jgi:hypothetical protein
VTGTGTGIGIGIGTLFCGARLIFMYISDLKYSNLHIVPIWITVQWLGPVIVVCRARFSLVAGIMKQVYLPQQSEITNEQSEITIRVSLYISCQRYMHRQYRHIHTSFNTGTYVNDIRTRREQRCSNNTKKKVSDAGLCTIKMTHVSCCFVISLPIYAMYMHRKYRHIHTNYNTGT